ncbi:MAG: CoA transferase [Deltaproteobacteria bacterium]|nr:CoA transferase [Deltaproteobacteria bacterium]
MNTRMEVQSTDEQALKDVNVLDFGWAIAGSLTGKYLGDYGATVIKVESSKRIDMIRTSRHVSISTGTNPDDKPRFVQLNTSKYGITLDLQNPRARAVIEKLIIWADVINENFTPGTMEKLGLDYASVKSINPRIIMISGSLFGQTGPLAREWGVDGIGAALSGHSNLIGWPDRGPGGATVTYGDYILPFFNVLAVVSALDYRRKTGKGQYIDASMLEIWTHMTNPAILDWQANANLQNRNGNRIPNASPHGVFPCYGEDRWCAIAVFTEKEWRSFCNVIDDPPWTKEPRFSTLSNRKEHEDELEKLMSEWTVKHEAKDIMHMMQKAGIAASVVQNAQDILDNDPQMREREFFVRLEHPVIGVFNHVNPPFKLLGTKPRTRTAPRLGEHNEYVCTHFLNISDDEFVRLLQDGVFE